MTERRSVVLNTDRNTTVRAILRGVAVLDSLLACREGLGVSELSRRVGLSKSTTHNIAGTLVEAGLLVVDAGTRRYQLGPKLAQLGSAFLDRLELRDAAQPFMSRLRDLVHETVSLHIRFGHQRTCIAQAVASQPLRRVLEIGSMQPLYRGGAGATLLAGLPTSEVIDYLRTVDPTPLTQYTLIERDGILQRVLETTHAGYYINEQESEIGVMTVTVPIRNHEGSVIAALVVSGPMPRWNRASIQANLDEIKGTATQISERLGHRLAAAADQRKAG